MSEVKVNKISPRTACGTTTLGDSGDTFTIPSGVTISNSGTATGFGATGEISWDTTVKTTGTFTATAGVGYFCNTTGGTITVNLPAGAAGSSVALADYAGTWHDNKVTVSPNGSEKMGGVAGDVDLTTEGQSVTFVYIDGTQGWVNVLDSTSNVRSNEFIIATGGCITTSGNDKIHKFTGPGTFCVSALAQSGPNNVVSYMVVAGGGGGGGEGGGAGAGGFREYKSPVTPYTASPLDGNPGGTAITVTATGYPITVGSGGAGAPNDTSLGVQGSSSIFSSITSTGGGYGGSKNTPAPQYIGGTGGSGGGVGRDRNVTAGAGNTPPTTPSQGNPGGSTGGSSGSAGGGGGGATAAGAAGTGPANPEVGGDGGAGATTHISASPVAYAGGGGGGSGDNPDSPGNSGSGGAGGGGRGGLDDAVSGTVNTGGGGGGSGQSPGVGTGAGGSGIVIIRYKYQ